MRQHLPLPPGPAALHPPPPPKSAELASRLLSPLGVQYGEVVRWSGLYIETPSRHSADSPPGPHRPKDPSSRANRPGPDASPAPLTALLLHLCVPTARVPTAHPSGSPQVCSSPSFQVCPSLPSDVTRVTWSLTCLCMDSPTISLCGVSFTFHHTRMPEIIHLFFYLFVFCLPSENGSLIR